MPWVHSESSFKDFLSLVIVHAPDEFPVEDYLKPEEQLTLSLAFSELHTGVEFLTGPSANPANRAELHALLDQALSAYHQGESAVGARLLQLLEERAFSRVQRSDG